MKKVLAVALILALAFCVMSPAMAASARIRVNNNTNITIYRLYLSPSYSTSWEEDVLGSDVLSAYESLNINFRSGIYTRYWDLRIEDVYGNYAYWEDIDLYYYSSITLTTDRYGNVQATYGW